MKKLFFFKSSSSGNGTDKQVRQEKASESRVKNQSCDQDEQDSNSSKSLLMKIQSEVSGGPAFRRSRSLSSAAFLVDESRGTSSNDSRNANGSQHRLRNHSSRCLTPERQYRERQHEGKHSHMYEVHDSSGSSSSCSSNVSSQVLDRYIDGEEHLEGSKQKSSSSRSNVSGSIGRKLPPRIQCSLSLLESVKEKQKSEGTRLNPSYTDWAENGLKDASPRSLARSVIERLSKTHGKSKASSYDPITLQDVYGGYHGRTFDSNTDVVANVPMAKHGEPANAHYADDHAEDEQIFPHGKNRHVGTNNASTEDNVDSELVRKYKEAEERLNFFSEEREVQNFFSDRDLNISALVGAITEMKEERVGLAFEVVSLLRSQMVERATARAEIRQVKTDWDLHIKRLEKEKSELQAGLEKELDRRSGEWSSKLEKFQLEEKRLRERVRELAEQNVSLQKEVSSFHEKETENVDIITDLDKRVTELTMTAEELHEENLYLKQNISKLEESYTSTTEDFDCLRRNFEEKDTECRELHKSITKILRTCKEQEETIQGLRNGFSEESKKQPLEKYEQLAQKLQMEQIRLTGVELSLRREVASMNLEAKSLRHEKICLLNRLKENAKEVDITTFKLDNEMKMRVCHLQEQGLSMLNESTQICYKLLKFIKEKPDQETQITNSGLSEQFMIDSETNVHGIRRGTENLKRSLEIVTSLLLEKSNEMASNSESSAGRPRELNNQSVEKTLRAEMRAETLVTGLLRDKLYSKEQEIEQLQAELAAAVRGNEILRCEIQNTLDNLSVNSHHLKDLKLQMVKKDESINLLEIELQETAKELETMRITLPKVLDEREQTWRKLRDCSERNKLMESEMETMKKKIEQLEEDKLILEGQITILKDMLGNKYVDILSSPVPEF